MTAAVKIGAPALAKTLPLPIGSEEADNAIRNAATLNAEAGEPMKHIASTLRVVLRREPTEDECGWYEEDYRTVANDSLSCRDCGSHEEVNDNDGLCWDCGYHGPTDYGRYNGVGGML